MPQWTTSKLKKKLMIMIAEQPEIFKLLDDRNAEYPDDLLDSRIFPVIKLDHTSTEAISFIGLKIDYPSICKNELYKNFNLTVMIVCDYGVLKTDIGECRTDAIAEKIIDLFNWNNQFDFTFELVSDVEDPLNVKYYFRRLTFKSISSNSIYAGVKKYD